MSSATLNRRDGAAPGGLSLQDAAERVGVAPSTLRRWRSGATGVETADEMFELTRVLVTRPVVARARGEIEFDRIAEVRLKGFTESTEVFLARARNESRPHPPPPR
jgi:transcriptional regulator with XRE-family HTH domain